MKKFPILYGVSSAKKVKQWEISVKDINGVPNIVVIHGYVNGKLQESATPVPEGKNLGRANETTPFDQACLEAESKWKKKKDKKYTETLPDEKSEDSGVKLPMLAHDYNKRSHDIQYNKGVYTQPKLDGVRCYATKEDESTVLYTSRSGKSFRTLEHLTEQLIESMVVGDIFDGEIFTTKLTFQQIISAIKCEEEDRNRDLLKFHIYDYASSEKIFSERYEDICEKIQFKEHLVIVETNECESHEEMLEHHDKYTKQGYEGTMIRNSNGKYKHRHRSKDLQKYKDFVDEEYVITGGAEGKGKSAGQCIFQCKTSTGKTFKVRCKGTDESREEQWENLESYIGKLITVQFQDKTDDGVPRFPVGIAIRDYE